MPKNGQLDRGKYALPTTKCPKMSNWTEENMHRRQPNAQKWEMTKMIN